MEIATTHDTTVESSSPPVAKKRNFMTGRKVRFSEGATGDYERAMHQNATNIWTLFLDRCIESTDTALFKKGMHDTTVFSVDMELKEKPYYCKLMMTTEDGIDGTIIREVSSVPLLFGKITKMPIKKEGNGKFSTNGQCRYYVACDAAKMATYLERMLQHMVVASDKAFGRLMGELKVMIEVCNTWQVIYNKMIAPFAGFKHLDEEFCCIFRNAGTVPVWTSKWWFCKTPGEKSSAEKISMWEEAEAFKQYIPHYASMLDEVPEQLLKKPSFLPAHIFAMCNAITDQNGYIKLHAQMVSEWGGQRPGVVECIGFIPGTGELNGNMTTNKMYYSMGVKNLDPAIAVPPGKLGNVLPQGWTILPVIADPLYRPTLAVKSKVQADVSNRKFMKMMANIAVARQANEERTNILLKMASSVIEECPMIEGHPDTKNYSTTKTLLALQQAKRVCLAKAPLPPVPKDINPEDDYADDDMEA